MRRSTHPRWLIFGLSLGMGLALVLYAASAEALTGSVVGTEVQVAYDEPTTNLDGSPLTDLASTHIYFDRGAGPVVLADIPATAPTGGGGIIRRVVIPAGEREEFDARLWATAKDTSGNESERSNEVVVRIDRLPPAAPK